MESEQSDRGERTFVLRTPLPASAEEAFAWHERPGAFERLNPPWERARLVERTGTIRDGDRAVIELRLGPLRRRWVAVHRDYVPGRQFADDQESGPFASWSHVHRFVPDGERSTLEDSVAYRLPLGAVGAALGGGIVERKLERMFGFRHRRLANDLERLSVVDRPLRIAVTGASGLIGSSLRSFLAPGGHDAVPVVRGAAGPGEAAWDPQAGIVDRDALEGLDAVVHLAGEPIAKRWTSERKRAIMRSRDEGTRVLAQALAGLERPPRVLVSASAIGYYGDRGDEVLTEESAPGADFLAGVCEAWESATDPARAAGIRVVNLRIGVVLEAVLPRLLLPFRLGLGGRIGAGRQWWSWIALDDLVGAIFEAVCNEELEGPVNAVAPGPVRNREFVKTLGRVLRRPALLPVPAPAIRLALGELGDAVLLASQRVEGTKLAGSGFGFSQPDLERALRHTLGR